MPKLNLFKRNERGQGLVETLIAVSVAVMVVTALVSLAVFALRNSRQSSYTAQATQIAQDQLELLRLYRDNSLTTWTAFYNLYSTSGSGCRPSSGGIPTCGGSAPARRCYYPSAAVPGVAPSQNTGTLSPFTYYFTVTCGGASCTTPSTAVLRANVYVTWQVGGKTQCVYNYTDFTNWRGK